MAAASSRFTPRDPGLDFRNHLLVRDDTARCNIIESHLNEIDELQFLGRGAVEEEADHPSAAALIERGDPIQLVQKFGVDTRSEEDTVRTPVPNSPPVSRHTLEKK